MFEKIGKSLDEFIGTVGNDLRMTRIEPKTDTVDVSYPEAANPKLRLEMGFGKLKLTKGNNKLVEGTITYNVQEWTPEIKAEGDTVTIRQGRGFHVIGGWDKAKHNWELVLGSAAPFDLYVGKGAGDNKCDLGGVALANANIETGAGSSTISFDQPNPVQANHIAVKIGAGETKMSGLLNTNAQYVTVEAGAGQLNLDVTGEALTRDLTVKINVGAGQVKVNIQRGVAARVSVSKGIGEVKARGGLTAKSNNLYETENYNLASAKVNFEITTGVGSVVIHAADEVETSFAS
jgi:hypothetical protein